MQQHDHAPHSTDNLPIDLPAFADTEDQTPLQAVTKGDLLATAVATACMIGGGALAVWLFT